jgi:hypothetical protein
VRALGTCLGLACLAAGCGKRGDPLPPIRRAPLPVTNLALAQRGASLEIRLTAPRAMTDGSRLASLAVELWVADRDGELAEVATRRSLAALPGEAWTETLPLPAPGSPLRVAAQARSGKRASVLTSVVTHTVQEVPEAPSALEARSAPVGVALRWTPPARMPAPPAPTPVPPPGPKLGAPPLATPPQAVPPGIEEPRSVPPTPLAPSPAPSPAPPVARVGFLVYRRAEGGSFGAPLNAVPLAAAAYADASARPGETLCYEVRTAASTDPVVESAPTPEACLAVRDVAAPAAPAGLAVILRDGAAELSWSPGLESDIAAYRVYRARGDGAPERVAELRPPETAWRDAELAAGTRHSYTVTAVDGAGNESPPSAAAELAATGTP